MAEIKILKVFKTGGVPLKLVVAINLTIMVVSLAVFPISYLLNRAPTSFIPLGGLVGVNEPHLVQMIYGPFGDGQFNKPMDVTVVNDKIYISDTNNQRIQVFDYQGTFLFAFGKRGNGQGEFEFPYGIAGDSAGHVYIADLYNGNISTFDERGTFLGYLVKRGDTDLLESPGDLFIKDDQIYMTDINKGHVLVYNLEGALVNVIGRAGTKPGEMVAPNGLAVDNENNIWVVDSGNLRVQVFNQTGDLIKSFNGNPEPNGESMFVNPRGIGIRGQSVMVVSNLTHTLWGFDLEGKQIFSIGGMGNLTSQFNLPNGLFVDENGRVYITDTVNARVAVYQ